MEFEKYLKKYKLGYTGGLKDNIYNKKCSRRFGRNNGPSSGEVKEKPHKSTDINKTLIKSGCL